jgi:hypothetical protein
MTTSNAGLPMERLTPEQLEHVRRYADDPTADPVERLWAIKRGMDHWTALLHETVEEARRRGIPWVDIADALGVSRQAASQRFTVVQPLPTEEIAAPREAAS